MTKTKKTLEIIKIAKNSPGLSQADALREMEKRGLRILTNREVDALLQDEKQREKYGSFFPIWTGTRVELNGKKTKIIENGKTVEKEVSESDDWFEQDEFGMPFGKSSDSSNKDARYLWRVSKYSGLVSRGCGFLDDGRRDVDCYYGGRARLGVLATPAKEHKHKWKTVCEDCGAKGMVK